MPRVSDLKNSKYLTKDDVNPPILVTISGWDYVDVSMENEPPAMRYILHFEEDVKPMTLNVTKGAVIEAMTGKEEFDDWVGHKIVLYHDPMIKYAGKIVGGIGVRPPKDVVPVKSLTPTEDDMPF
jgi:hypothetical protein